MLMIWVSRSSNIDGLDWQMAQQYDTSIRINILQISYTDRSKHHSTATLSFHKDNILSCLNVLLSVSVSYILGDTLIFPLKKRLTFVAFIKMFQNVSVNLAVEFLPSLE